MTPQQMNARHLYFDGRKTQKEIAAELGVSEKTIYNWIQYFGWHKMREAAIIAPCIIADNLSRQIIKFQAAIDAREEGTDFPTPEEIGLQCKLINCLDKLKKYPTKGQAAQSIVTFINFITDDNSPLADTLWDKYNDFMNQKPAIHKPWHIEAGINPFFHTPPFEAESPQQETTVANPAHEAGPAMKVAPQSDEKPETVKKENELPETGNAIKNKVEYQHFMPSKPAGYPFPPPVKTGNPPATNQQSNTLEKPPVTEQDFKDYGHLLTDFTRDLDEDGTVVFRGKVVNAKWLDYNLFQYCLPLAERRFITDVQRVIREVDYKALCGQIARHRSFIDNMAA